MADEVTRRDVIAFRLASHHLGERLPEGGLLEAAHGCGVQNSPPGSALLALHARVRGITQAQLATALDADKTLLQTWSLRGAPFAFPTADASVFTAGVMPPTEAGQRHLIRGVEPALDAVGMSLREAVDRCGAGIGDVLSGRRLAIDELGLQLAARIARRLPDEQRRRWESPGPYAAGQPWGEAIVHFCLRILTLRGVVCFAPRAGNKAPFVLVEEWLGHPIADADSVAARTELLRRYLHCYGPSTRAHFAAWLGVNVGDVGPWWDPIADELTPVVFRGKVWVHTDDLDVLRSRPTPRGVRLLPPRDPYTQLRDRDTIVDRHNHGEVWKTAGDPGTLLIDGEIAGVWRPRKTGAKVTVGVRAFDALPDRTQALVRDEAEQLALLRGAKSAVVDFAVV